MLPGNGAILTKMMLLDIGTRTEIKPAIHTLSMREYHYMHTRIIRDARKEFAKFAPDPLG
jgi:hypothetical protein